MIITSNMHKIIQIHPCLLKLSRKRESVTDGRTLLLHPPPLSRGDNKSNEIDGVNKASETVYALKWVRPTTAIPITDTSTDTPCPLEVECLVTTVSHTSGTTNSNSLLSYTASIDIQQYVNSGDFDIDSQSDCHTDSDSHCCAPEVMVPDARVLSSIKNEQNQCGTPMVFM